MFNKQLKQNIIALDLQIDELMKKLIAAKDEEGRKVIFSEIEQLSELRCKLANSKVSESYTKEVLAGLISVSGMILVLKHEKADVITTKAFSMAQKLFRG